MENRIERQDAETLHQPKSDSERISKLYNLRQVTGKPMTALLDQAINEFAERHGTIFSVEEDPAKEEIQIESWTEYREYQELSDEMKYLRCLEELEKIKQEHL